MVCLEIVFEHSVFILSSLQPKGGRDRYFSFHKWGNWVIGRLNNVSRIIELESGGTMLQTRVVFVKLYSGLWLGRFKIRGFPWETSHIKLIVKNLKIPLLCFPLNLKQTSPIPVLNQRSNDKLFNGSLKIFALRLRSKHLENSDFVFSFPLGFLLHPGIGNVPPFWDPVTWLVTAGIILTAGSIPFFERMMKQKTSLFLHLASSKAFKESLTNQPGL